ncbi:MAG: metallophosphoesterase [Bacteroides sp.]|nr:metallophosphoesterase [Bacteroides sp.]
MTRKTLLIVWCLMAFMATLSAQTLNRSAWMKGLADDIPVARLTIPATHDSGALLGGEALQTQDISIREQLEAGVRGFDIRLQACDNGKLGVYHSVQFQDIYWETDVLPAFLDFLKKYPSEMLFVSLKKEGGDSDAYRRLAAASLNDQSLAPYLVTDFKNDLTLGDCRGKILFMHRDRILKDYPGAQCHDWGDNVTCWVTLKDAKGNETLVSVEDEYGYPNGNKASYKGRITWKNMKAAMKNAGKNHRWYISFASATALPVAGPSAFSDVVNPMLAKQTQGLEQPCGIVLIDFAGTADGRTLIDNLILSNRPKPVAMPLRFKGGKLRIAQLTDIHWRPGSEKSEKNPDTILKVLEMEKPDVIILTGDVVTHQPAKEGWRSVVGMMEASGIPFAVTMGNHDAENWPEDSIYHYLSKSRLFIGEKGPEALSGTGNYILPVYASDGTEKVKALLYCMDSNDYTKDAEKFGNYAWIEWNQIAWYREQSRWYAAQNNGQPLPALAFFHIGVPEFKHIQDRPDMYGHLGENGGFPKINSGMFNAMIEQGDVMGVFVGHDHDNDYIGQEYGIALAYGRVSGHDAYGDLERGARIIELYEDKRQFDTWITTPSMKSLGYYYPSGITLDDEANAVFLSKPVNPTKNGVSYIYYEGKFKHTDHFKTNGTKKEEGVMSNFSILNAPAKDHFGYEFKSYIKIPKTGVYNFYLYSDDGSLLYVDGKEVIDNNGSHSAARKGGKVPLEAGFHEVRLLYFEDYMGEKLRVKISSRWMEEQDIPDGMLYLP